MDNKNYSLPSCTFTINQTPETIRTLYRKEYAFAVSRFESEGGHVIGLRSNKVKAEKISELPDEAWFSEVPFL